MLNEASWMAVLDKINKLRLACMSIKIYRVLAKVYEFIWKFLSGLPNIVHIYPAFVSPAMLARCLNFLYKGK